MPSFNVREIPFSYEGSWINLSPVVALHRAEDDIHLISHITGMHAVLRLVPTRATRKVEAEVAAQPSALTWIVEGKPVARAVFESTTVLRIAGRGTEFTISDAAKELTPFSGSYFFEDPLDGAHVFTSYESGRRYRITVLRGSARAYGVQALGQHQRAMEVSGHDGWEIAIQEMEASAPPYVATEKFDDVTARVAGEFGTYLHALAGWATESTPAAALAAYVLWSATVSPAGFLTRDSVMMSKHWMDKVWSWDHAFNALALAPGAPDLAIDQFLTPFDHQDDAGALPDSVTHSEVLYNFVKPPIHGWALSKLRERLARDLSRAELENIYARLSRWTNFWLNARTAPGRELPFYQHGNDSGWDNSTTFDYDRVIESPDLAAFLIIQLDVLSSLSTELGLADAEAWRIERDRIRQALVGELLDTDGFFAVGVFSRTVSKRTSLLNQLPILAADHLPAGVVAELAARIQNHLTQWGPATELLDSPAYESDGYWRGPIWAPSTMLIEQGLRSGGHTALADAISERFRRLCEKSGFAENFDALSGNGLRDRAYTWTASVYLVLAHEHLLRSGIGGSSSGEDESDSVVVDRTALPGSR